MLPRTATILLPLVCLLLAPLPLGLLLRRLFPNRRAYFTLAFLLAGFVSLAVARVALPLTADSLRPAPRGNVAEANSFVVFAFGLGQPVEGKPTAGESNLALARWLLKENPQRKPTIVQEGVYLALRELDAPHLDEWVTCLPSPPGVYIDTYGGALQTEVVLALKHLKRPVLVAHDLQLERMVWTFEEGGRSDFVVPNMPPTPFDPNSSQHGGTKSRGAWVVREVFAARPVTLRMRWTAYAVAAVALVYLVVLWRLVPPKAAASPA
ncbi:MAG TPA: hypothetical protein VMZ71_08620 [Gemmataceae bacterium]|nr:hypothetical protein [Gemmataceae bacterium]